MCINSPSQPLGVLLPRRSAKRPIWYIRTVRNIHILIFHVYHTRRELLCMTPDGKRTWVSTTARSTSIVACVREALLSQVSSLDLRSALSLCAELNDRYLLSHCGLCNVCAYRATGKWLTGRAFEIVSLPIATINVLCLLLLRENPAQRL